MHKEIVKLIHASGYKIFVAATGGGTSFLGEFLKIPGGSSVIVGGHIPYAKEATDKFLGETLDKYANGLAARKLALKSYWNLVDMGFSKNEALGVGIACSLAKDNEREDRKHHINIAIHRFESTGCFEIELAQGKTREQEEQFINSFVLAKLAELSNCDDDIYPSEENKALLEKLVGEMMLSIGNIEIKMSGVSKNRPYANNVGLIFIDEIAVYSGSFNPLHSGHEEIHAMASTILEMPVYFEMSTLNYDKPAFDNIEMAKRFSQFNSEDRIIITDAPRYVDKVKYLIGLGMKKITFVVGADTWARVYNDDAIIRGDIDYFENNGVKFLVFGRKGVTIENMQSSLLILDNRALEFCNPISSTQIRNEAKTN